MGKEKDKLVQRYTALALQYSQIPNGAAWKPEYEELKTKLKAEMNRIRKELGMDPIGAKLEKESEDETRRND